MFATTNGPRIYALREEIATLRQGEMTVENYYGQLKSLWGDEEELTNGELCDLGIDCKSTRCLNARKALVKVVKFLMGLNETHFQKRAQILALDALPAIEKVYAMIIQKEVHSKLNRAVVVEASAMFSSSNAKGSNQGAPKQNFKGGNQASGNEAKLVVQGLERDHIYSTHCRSEGLVKETCWQLHGYPPGYRQNGKFKNNKKANNTVNSVVVENGGAGPDNGENNNTTEAVQMSSIQIITE